MINLETLENQEGTIKKYKELLKVIANRDFDRIYKARIVGNLTYSYNDNDMLAFDVDLTREEILAIVGTRLKELKETLESAGISVDTSN